MKLNKVPVLFLIFNRPDTTKKIFTEIRRYKPEQLFIAADGPRKNKLGEGIKCEDARRVTEKIDWPCKVKRLYRDKNLGCRKAVSSAIDWFFDNVKAGLILEDDCFPGKSFFKFCELMLRKYENNSEVFHIGANNFQPRRTQFANGYYFSKYPHVWGWATWRRAWKHYDVGIKSWPSVKKKGILKKYWNNFWERIYWETIFDATYSDKIDTWDYQWLYTTWINNALSIVPGVNLVQNIGFNIESTHTSRRSILFEKKAREMAFPLKVPKNNVKNLMFDNYEAIKNFHAEPLTITVLKARYFLDKYLSGIYKPIIKNGKK
ncbi:MAG: hypothetical protein ABSE04_03415 [Candidatus Microgenomates bacterium]|jgi:hypothetical protein